MEKVHILLIEPDESTAAFLRQVLSRVGFQVQVVSSGKEGLINAWRDQPDIIVLELNLPDLNGLEVVRKLRGDQRTSRKMIVGLTSRSQPEDTIAGLEAGLNQYIVKQADAIDTLLRYLTGEQRAGQLRQKVKGPIPSNYLIAFLSAKGGVGTSSLCINVASQISRQDSKHTVVVLDLVLPIGSLAQITGSKRPIDLVQLTKMTSGELTPEYLRKNLLAPKSWGFYLVPGCNDPHQAVNLQTDRLSPIIQTLQAAFTYLIVDIGRDLSHIAMLVLRQADAIVMILTPDEPGISSSHIVRNYLLEEGVIKDRLLFLCNRPLATEGLNVDAIEAALGHKINVSIPNMGTRFHLANTLHAPLHLRCPEESATLAINRFSANLLQHLKQAGDKVRLP